MLTNISLFAALLVVAVPVGEAAQRKTKSAEAASSILTAHHFRAVQLQKRSGGGWAFQVSINGKAATLLPDTGAPITVLDRNSIRRFGLRERATNISLTGTLGRTDEHVNLAQVKRLEFSNIVLTDFEAGIIDESALNRSLPRSSLHVDGVLGYSQLRRLGAVLDCGADVLYVNPHGATREASTQLGNSLVQHGFVRIPMHFSNYHRLPEVDCRINARRSRITVETVAFTTILDKQVAARAGIGLTPANFSSEGVGRRSAPVTSGVAREFVIGTFRTENEKVCAAQTLFSVLGWDYLHANHAVIDLAKMDLFLRH